MLIQKLKNKSLTEGGRGIGGVELYLTYRMLN